MSDEVCAYHEAGHAFMAVFLGARVQSISIDPDRDDGPRREGDVRVAWNLRRMTRRQLQECEILVSLAGPVAEMIHTQEPAHPAALAEWSADWQAAWEAAAPLCPDPRRRVDYLEQVLERIRQMLEQDEHWAALAAIVDELLAHERLEGAEVEAIVGRWLG